MTANDLPTAAPLGFDNMQGLTRRPNFHKWPGLSKAIATLVRYAKRSEDGLKARVPRIQWMTPKWQPSVMGDIMEKVGNKRKLLQGQEIQPDMAQRTLRLKTSKNDEVHVSKPAESEHDHQQPTSSIPGPTGQPTTNGNNTTDTPTRHSVRKNTRMGPCAFGCATTTNIRKGVQVWKIPPVPCPWPGIARDADLCNKCYSKGITRRNKHTAELSLKRRVDASDSRRSESSRLGHADDV